MELLPLSANTSANSSYQRWLEAYESRRTAPATATVSSSAWPGSRGGAGSVASVYAANRSPVRPGEEVGHGLDRHHLGPTLGRILTEDVIEAQIGTM